MGLIYASDQEPGIRRLKTAKGFRYVQADGSPVKDPATLDRIAHIVIPPAWTEVWICPDPIGHIQATGRDAKGRKQARYHPQWRAVRDGAKFERMAAFGRALPRLRKQVEADLARRGLPREKVLAGVVRLLETTLIRIGNDEYAQANKSFGLTTLRKRHAHVTSTGAVFEFTGKSGKKHRTGFRDRRLARLVRSCQELPGQRLFQYVDHDGTRHAIGSAEVNAYIRQAIGEDFSAKDFRTWAGTVLAAQFAGASPVPATKAELKRLQAACCKAVSERLGNTPAVCRSAYIHPAILDCVGGEDAPRQFSPRRNPEKALLAFLNSRAQ